MFLLPAATCAGRTATTRLVAEAPRGFDELAGPHEAIVDVYYGGVKVTEAAVDTRPGTLRFRNPAAVVAAVPNLVVTPEVTALMERELATHSDRVCVQSNRTDCGMIRPEVVGIVYDEDRFRVDLFFNPKYVKLAQTSTDTFLPRQDRSISLTDTFGADIAGAFGRRSNFDIENRTIVAFGGGRLRADAAVASGIGLLVDDFVGEVERGDRRYSAGIFWAPGNDFIGERRIIGAGFSTQLDTWADHDSLTATPLIVFLTDRSRIDVLVDGRLLSSKAYAAGNVEVDTSNLGEGSYSVLLRIHHANGTIEEQRRFFVKNSQVPPTGHMLVMGYGGVLANTRRDDPISASRTLFYQLGAARRLNNNIALDLTALGTQHKAIFEGGAWVISPAGRVRAAGLISSSGDWGALMQLSAGGHGPLTMAVDLRRIWSRNSGPLVPLPSRVPSFDEAPPSGLQQANGSYTQAEASIGWRLASGSVSLVGSYRKERNYRADYTIGPSVSVPIMTRNLISVVFDASAQRSRTATAAFAGLRLLASSRHFAAAGTFGHGSLSEGSAPHSSVSRMVGSASLAWSRQDNAGQELMVEAGADRNVETSTLHAEADMHGGFGDLHADILKSLKDERTTQYNLAFQSGVAIGVNGSAWGSRELQKSALIVTVRGDASGTKFNVLIDEVARGELEVGHRLALYLPSYRTYHVRLVPLASQNVSYDTAERQITLYPGTVHAASWLADRYLTLFGQAIGRGGAPVTEALLHTPKGIAETDANGYFQIDARKSDAIVLEMGDGKSCTLKISAMTVKGDFASVGRVACE